MITKLQKADNPELSMRTKLENIEEKSCFCVGWENIFFKTKDKNI